MTTAMTRDELVAALTEQRQALEQWFAARTPEELERPLTDSEVPGGERWRAKDHLAHALGTERYLRGVAQRTLAGDQDPAGFFSQLGSLEREPLMRTINQANGRAYTKYHDEPVESLLARMRQTRQETLAYLATLNDEQLNLPSPHSPFGHGTVRDLFRQIYQHDHLHLGWLTAALAGHDEHKPFSL